MCIQRTIKCIAFMTYLLSRYILSKGHLSHLPPCPIFTRVPSHPCPIFTCVPSSPVPHLHPCPIFHFCPCPIFTHVPSLPVPHLHPCPIFTRVPSSSMTHIYLRLIFPLHTTLLTINEEVYKALPCGEIKVSCVTQYVGRIVNSFKTVPKIVLFVVFHFNCNITSVY